MLYWNIKTSTKDISPGDIIDFNEALIFEPNITDLIPGKYFIEETKANDGYKKLENNIEFDIALNEELTIDISNEKQEKLEDKTVYNNNKKYKQETIGKNAKVNEIHTQTLTKLPVTGM